MSPRLRHDPAQRERFAAPQEMPCPLCGALARFAPQQRLLPCPSCAAPLVRGPDDQTPVAPTGALPFLVNEAAVPAMAAAGVRTLWFRRPKGAVLTSFERIYVPVWCFTTHVVCSWVQDYSHRDAPRPPRKTGEFSADYELQVVASTEVNAELLQKLEKTPLAGAEPLPAAWLKDVRILPVDVALQDAWVKARMHFDARAMAGSSAQGYFVFPSWSREEGALVLVPAYLGWEETTELSAPVIVDGISGTVYGGIGRIPSPRQPGTSLELGTWLQRAAACVMLWVGLEWLGILPLGLIKLLDAIFGSGRPLTADDIFGR